MRKKTIIILLIASVGLFFLWTGYLWKFFSCSIAGSDPCAEYWDLNISETNLVKVIEEVKKEHPEINPPFESYLTPKKRDYGMTFHFTTQTQMRTFRHG